MLASGQTHSNGSSNKGNNQLFAIVIESYCPSQSSDQLTLLQGEMIRITDESGDWLCGQVYDKTGWFPKSCVDILWDWQPSQINSSSCLERTMKMCANVSPASVSLIDSDDKCLLGSEEDCIDPECNARPIETEVILRQIMPGDYRKLEEFSEGFESAYSEIGHSIEYNSNGCSEAGGHLAEPSGFVQLQKRLVLLNEAKTAFIALGSGHGQEFGGLQERIDGLEKQLNQAKDKALLDGNPLEIDAIEKILSEYRQLVSEHSRIRDRLEVYNCVEDERNLLDELRESEQQFHLLLRGLIDKVAAPSEFKIGCDTYHSIFGHLESVAEFSLSFLESMLALEHPATFIDANYAEFCDLFGGYVANYNYAISSLGSVNTPSRSHLIDAYQAFIQDKPITKSLELFLYLPVERLFQYSVFFGRLRKIMQPSDHNFELTVSLQTRLIDFILSLDQLRIHNSVVYKYLTKHDISLLKRIGKCNFNSMDKVAGRAVHKMLAKCNLRHLIVDSKFDELEKTFRTLRRGINKFVNEAKCYITWMNSTSSSYDRLCAMVSATTQNDSQKVTMKEAVNTMEKDIEQTVFIPLRTILFLLKRPQMLINKRFDMLIDYARYRSTNKVMADAALNDYIGLNLQLCSLLPKLHTRVQASFLDCTKLFFSIQSQMFLNFHHQRNSSDGRDIASPIRPILDIPLDFDLTSMFTDDVSH